MEEFKDGDNDSIMTSKDEDIPDIMINGIDSRLVIGGVPLKNDFLKENFKNPIPFPGL